ncbi:NAD(P)-dependent oxidoreductase [Bacilliculturomica massiliensis]|uniref:NAD(P)-dependent oxidoreductase n=1 Tax=Bacilliculturomica massiliensis TaxID=1917867 RepID=UPI0010310922|nr:NAD(P)-dependent oxidoreductase [Bacilliculturomica massiliensis]
MTRRVGFIGLGAMGLPMAKNIGKSGYLLSVLDIDPVPVQIMEKEYGARAGKTPREICLDCDVVITMLPDAETVVKVAAGKDGLLCAMRSGSVWIDMTTGDPFITEELARQAEERNISLIDAPVGRSPKHAETGDLLILAGGRQEAIEKAMPVLNAVGRDVICCGGAGAGHTMKLINNLLSGVIQEANIEAISIGMRAGISVSTMLQAFSQACAWNGYLAGLPFEEESAPGWKVKTAEKHMECVQRLADRYGVPVCCTAAVGKRMREMIDGGKGDTKYSNIKTLMKDMAGMAIVEDVEPPIRAEF